MKSRFDDVFPFSSYLVPMDVFDASDASKYLRAFCQLFWVPRALLHVDSRTAIGYINNVYFNVFLPIKESTAKSQDIPRVFLKQVAHLSHERDAEYTMDDEEIFPDTLIALLGLVSYDVFRSTEGSSNILLQEGVLNILSECANFLELRVKWFEDVNEFPSYDLNRCIPVASSSSHQKNDRSPLLAQAITKGNLLTLLCMSLVFEYATVLTRVHLQQKKLSNLLPKNQENWMAAKIKIDVLLKRHAITDGILVRNINTKNTGNGKESLVLVENLISLLISETHFYSQTVDSIIDGLCTKDDKKLTWRRIAIDTQRHFYPITDYTYMGGSAHPLHRAFFLMVEGDIMRYGVPLTLTTTNKESDDERVSELLALWDSILELFFLMGGLRFDVGLGPVLSPVVSISKTKIPDPVGAAMFFVVFLYSIVSYRARGSFALNRNTVREPFSYGPEKTGSTILPFPIQRITVKDGAFVTNGTHVSQKNSPRTRTFINNVPYIIGE